MPVKPITNFLPTEEVSTFFNAIAMSIYSIGCKNTTGYNAKGNSPFFSFHFPPSFYIL